MTKTSLHLPFDTVVREMTCRGTEPAGGPIVEGFLVLGLATYIGGALLVGWVTDQRGRGFAVGFWISIIFSPLIGLLVAIALAERRGGVSAAAMVAPHTAAQDAWRRVQSSLDESEYADFLTAFVGSSESMQAARHKRQLESWRALDKSDTAGIEAFLAGDVFLALRNRVRTFIESEAGGSPELSALLSKFRTAEAEEKRLADQAAQKLEEERIQAEELKSAAARKAAAAEAATKASDARVTRIWLGVVLVLGAAGLAAMIYVEAAKQAECKNLTLALAEKKAEFQRLNAPFKKQLSSMEEELASLEAKRNGEVALLARDLQSQAIDAVSITFKRRGVYGVDVRLVNDSEYCVMPLSPGVMVDIEFYRGGISVGDTLEIYMGGSGCLPAKSTRVFEDVSTVFLSGTADPAKFDRVEIARAREFVDPRTREPVDWAEIAKQKTPDLDASRRAELEEKISAEKANPSPAEAAKQVAETNDALSSCPAESAE